MIGTFLAITALTAGPAGPVGGVSDGPSVNPGSRAAKLMELYEKGSVPSVDDVLGVRTGRCYLTTNPDHPIGTALVAERRSLGVKDGPLFDRVIAKFDIMGQGVGGRDAPPEQFDNPSREALEAIRAHMDQLFADEKIKDAATGRSLAMELRDLRFELRKQKEDEAADWGVKPRYTFAQVTSLAGKGGTYAYCYFFKRVDGVESSKK